MRVVVVVFLLPPSSFRSDGPRLRSDKMAACGWGRLAQGAGVVAAGGGGGGGGGGSGAGERPSVGRRWRPGARLAVRAAPSAAPAGWWIAEEAFPQAGRLSGSTR